MPTQTPDQSASAEPAVGLAPVELQKEVLGMWLRSNRAALQLAVGTQYWLVDRGRALLQAMAAGPTAAPRTQLEWWATGMAEAQELVRAAMTEVRYSADDLLEQLEQEESAHQETRTELDRVRARAERLAAERASTAQARDAAQARAEELEAEQRRLERTHQRLERELAEHKARVEQLERERDEQREREEQRARGERQRAAREAGAAQPESSTSASADKQPVNVVRREEDWAVIRENARRASGVFDTKREAVQRAREIASHDGVEVHVQPANGSTEQS